jgi:hypothetical protein
LTVVEWLSARGLPPLRLWSGEAEVSGAAFTLGDTPDSAAEGLPVEAPEEAEAQVVPEEAASSAAEEGETPSPAERETLPKTLPKSPSALESADAGEAAA